MARLPHWWANPAPQKSIAYMCSYHVTMRDGGNGFMRSVATLRPGPLCVDDLRKLEDDLMAQYDLTGATLLFFAEVPGGQ